MAIIGLVVSNPLSPSPSRDVPLKTLLETYGHTVTYIDDSNTPMIGVYELIIITESATTSNAQDWHDLDIPILTTELALTNQGYGSGNSTSGAGDETGKVNETHYITDDYSLNDEFEYCQSGDDRGYVTGFANDAKALVVIANNTARALIVAIEDGDTDANGDTAINRRVIYAHARPSEWTNDGENVFLRCVNWCLGLDAGGNNYTEDLSNTIDATSAANANAQFAENPAGNVETGDILAGLASFTENPANTSEIADILNNNATFEENPQSNSELLPLLSSAAARLETLTAVQNMTDALTASLQATESLVNTAAAVGDLPNSQEQTETLAAVGQTIDAVSAGIEYIEVLTATNASIAIIEDMRTYFENLFSEIAVYANIDAAASLIQNLQSLTNNVFQLSGTVAAREILSNVSAAIAKINDVFLSNQRPKSRYDFGFRLLNTNFKKPGLPVFCYQNKMEFAA